MFRDTVMYVHTPISHNIKTTDDDDDDVNDTDHLISDVLLENLGCWLSREYHLTQTTYPYTP